jgi:hypothetical protein
VSTTILAAILFVLGVLMYVRSFTNSVALLRRSEALPKWVRTTALIRPSGATERRSSLFAAGLALLGAIAPQIVVAAVLLVRASDFDVVGIALLVLELTVVAIWTLFVLVSYWTWSRA